LSIKVEPPDFLEIGLKPYREVWDLQKNLQSELISGTGKQTVILCEHPAVITLGTSADTGNVLAKEETLKKRGVEVVRIERGGDVTYHGPGQLVVYPILNLNNYRRDVDWYLRLLEGVIIETMAEFGVSGIRIPGKTGVWTSPTDKIASIGVRFSRWCSMHGLALNVTNTEDGFDLINPCGFKDIKISSLRSCGARVEVKEVSESIKKHLLKALGH
jgi:lipoyl(octanoyl) transferase